MEQSKRVIATDNFKDFCKLCDLTQEAGAICVEGSLDWAKDFRIPQIELGLPTVEKRSKIAVLMSNRNPIVVCLEDKTRLYFTYEEYRRIKGTPEVGRTILVKMIRMPQDASGVPSKIQSCEVI